MIQEVDCPGRYEPVAADDENNISRSFHRDPLLCSLPSRYSSAIGYRSRRSLGRWYSRLQTPANSPPYFRHKTISQNLYGLSPIVSRFPAPSSSPTCQTQRHNSRSLTTTNETSFDFRPTWLIRCFNSPHILPNGRFPAWTQTS